MRQPMAPLIAQLSERAQALYNSDKIGIAYHEPTGKLLIAFDKVVSREERIRIRDGCKNEFEEIRQAFIRRREHGSVDKR